MENLKNKAVLYLRLSDEDRNKLSKEELSESIKNQEKMLKEYARKWNFNIVGIYNDEDFSGASKTRPHFNEMIEECQKGNVDIVLVKSQSRFARDMELIEKYVHNLFHQWNIRFITVIDRIDNTKTETKKTSQITAMTDQWYLEDTSNNIRQTLKIKRSNGEFTGSFAPYGYIKDKHNKNHLVVDNIAALIVKRIYDEYIRGYGLKKIATNLNNDNILSPLEYKKIMGCKLYIPLLKNNENYDYIKKTGSYKININITNYQDQLTNLVIYNYLTTDRQTFNNKCDIYLKKYLKDKINIYYTTKQVEKNYLDLKDWKLLEENTLLPKNTTCLMTLIKKLDRKQLVNYQLEIVLKENIDQLKYYFDVLSKEDVKIDINIRKKYKWSEQTIKKILTDEVYIGNLVQFKTTSVSYKNHTIIRNDKQKWIRVENTHEAIIDKKTWFMVQNRRLKKSRSDKLGYINPFSNKIFCKCCNQVFKTCGNGYLSCQDRKNKWTNCNNKKFIKKDELNDFVKLSFNKLLNKFYDLEQLNNLNQQEIKNIKEDKVDALKKELNILNKEIKNKKSFFLNLYEDKINGILSNEEFITLKSDYNNNIDKLENRVDQIKKEIKIIKNNQTKTIDLKKYQKLKNINSEIIDNFVSKIYIAKFDEIKNTREIKIIWNFK